MTWPYKGKHRRPGTLAPLARVLLLCLVLGPNRAYLGGVA